MQKNHKIRVPRYATYAKLVQDASKALLAGDAKTCQRLADQALAQTFPSGDAWFLMGASLLVRGKTVKASRLLKATVEAWAPQTAILAYLLAVSYHRQGKLERAEPFLPLVAWDPELWESLGRETDFELVRRRSCAVASPDPAFG